MRFVTDEAGNKLSYYAYQPFGGLRVGQGSDGMLYQTQQLDNESGLYYLRARQYDPTTGRFISRDPYAGSLKNPLSQNAYIYGYSNPVNNADPSGEAPMPRTGNPYFDAPASLIDLIYNFINADGDPTNELKFFNGERLLDHFTRHAKGLGYKNISEYLRGAQKLFQGGKGVQTYTRLNGDRLFFNSKTNEFGILSKDKVIRTYYSPEKGLQYYLNEIAKDKANRLK